MTSDFGGGGKNNKERLEYVKRQCMHSNPMHFMSLTCFVLCMLEITMDQEVTHQRTTKVTQATNGGAVEAMKTHVIKSIHKESHLMSNNYGPMGVTDSEEIDEARKALSNRSWAVLVPPAPPSRSTRRGSRRSARRRCSADQSVPDCHVPGGQRAHL